MTPSLERLAELVRQAEAKTRAKKVGAEVRQAAEQFRAAEERARAAAQRFREERPLRLRDLEQADTDEHQLKELVRKLAQFKASLEAEADAENLISTAQTEIEQKRRDARADLEAIQRETDETRRELRSTMDHYQHLRRELDRLQPESAAEFVAEDRLLWDAETHFPGGQLQLLAREVEAGSNAFGGLAKMEQYAQLKLWIGRYRLYQATNDTEPTEEGQTLSQRVFHQLKGLSKQHEPGYIEAFRQDFSTDWNAYVAEAQEQLHQATEAVRRSRDSEHQRQEQQARDHERHQQTREAGMRAFDGLKTLLGRIRLPDEGLADFLDLLGQAISGLGAADPRLLEFAMPYRELISGGDTGLRALRRNLDRIHQEGAIDAAIGPGPYEDLVPSTRGLRALMIGGSVREDARRSLQRTFGFDRLDWEPYEEPRPALLESLVERVRNRGVDLVLILKSFIGHHVTERLRPACDQAGVLFLVVEHGYGPAQIGEALRRGLPKSA